MGTIEADKPYPRPNEYWKLVHETLMLVFQLPRQQALRLVDNRRLQFNDRPFDEQLQFYHAEPLDIAADLAEKRPNDVDVNAYLKLASKLHWKP